MLVTLLLLLQGIACSPISTATFKRSIDNGVHLKMLPLGASITHGVRSTDGNGYRLDLWHLLDNNGNPPSYVGTQGGGSMIHNANEGYPGYTIAEVDNAAEKSGVWDYIPNVVLLFAGTNDCAAANRGNIAQAPASMATILSHIRGHSPNALTVVAGPIQNLDPAQDACIKTLDDHWGTAVQNAASKGQRVIFKNMYDTVPRSDIHTDDKTHPNDAGYDLIAKAWFDALSHSSIAIETPNPKGKPAPTHIG